MDWMLFISIVLIVISAISKAIMDVISEGKWTGWWNKEESWVMYFKDDDYLDTYCKNDVPMEPMKWKDGDPSKGEKFFGSSTFLVWLTDGWHFFQMVFLNTLIAGVLLFDVNLELWISFLILAVGFKVVFEIVYRILK